MHVSLHTCSQTKQVLVVGRGVVVVTVIQLNACIRLLIAVHLCVTDYLGGVLSLRKELSKEQNIWNFSQKLIANKNRYAASKIVSEMASNTLYGVKCMQ